MPPKTTQSHPKPPKANQGHPKLTKTNQNQPKLPKADHGGVLLSAAQGKAEEAIDCWNRISSRIARRRWLL